MKRKQPKAQCQCQDACQCQVLVAGSQDAIKRPSDYIKDGAGYDHIRHFMKPEYLNEGHNISSEDEGTKSLTGAIVDPIVGATVDDPALRECLKAAGHAITGGIDPSDPAVRKCLKELSK